MNCAIFYSRLIRLDLWYHLMLIEVICTCTFGLCNDLYVINSTYLYHYIVVLDKYTHSNLV